LARLIILELNFQETFKYNKYWRIISNSKNGKWTKCLKSINRNDGGYDNCIRRFDFSEFMTKEDFQSDIICEGNWRTVVIII